MATRPSNTHAAENTKYDFSTMPEGVVIGRNCAVENGVLVVRHSPENTFPIGTTEAIKLSFQLKVRRLLPGKSRNLGINLYSKNGEYGFFFVSENEGVVGHWNVIENGTVRRKNGAWSSRDIKVIPKEGQTMKFELFVRKGRPACRNRLWNRRKTLYAIQKEIADKKPRYKS